jgi:hypothetical protein
MNSFPPKAYALPILASMFLSACGGSTTNSSLTTTTPPPGSFIQSYTASWSAGEIVQLGIDTTTMTYTFKILLSSHSLAGKTGKGNITSQNADGSFNLAASPDGVVFGGKIFAVKNGEVSGYVSASLLAGYTFNVPVLGTSNPILTIPSMAGTYNYVSYSCPTATSGNVIGTASCTTDFGTMSIANSFTFLRCNQQDLTTNATCASSSTGTLSVANSVATSTAVPGVFNMTRNGATTSGWMFAYTAANGKRVAVVDLIEAAAAGSYGYGQMVMTDQSAVVSADIDGKYALFNFIEGAKPTTLAGTGYTTGSTSTTTGSINLNTPWPGMVTWSDSTAQYGGHAIIAGTGIFASQMTPSTVGPFSSFTSKWFEVGLKH